MTEVYLGKELHKGIVEGVKKLKTSVTSTLGPGGRTVLIKDKNGKLKATKDGVSVAKEFNQLENPIENAGAQMVKEVASKTNDLAGDGTTTSTLLASSIIEQGFKLIDNGVNVVKLKKGIDDATSEIIEALEYVKEDVTEHSQIKEVATISGNGDEEIGNLISNALDKVGRDGVVSIEKAKNGETILEVVEGMQFDKGYKSPYFVTDNNKMNTVLENPLILLYDGRITSGQDLIPVMTLASETNTKSLIVIADDIEGEALATLIVNKQRGIVNSVAVKAPDFGDRRKAVLEDIAIITGGTVLSKDKGHNLEKLTEVDLNKYLGNARLITVDKETTTIVDGDCKKEDIENRTKELINQVNLSQSSFEIEKLQERIGRLSSGVAVIYVGGNSEIEIEEKKDRMVDALFAAKASIEEGIVAGGGVALLKVRNSIKFNNADEHPDVLKGKKLIFDMCSEPFIRILTNCGFDITDAIIIMKDIEKNPDIWLGYDVFKKEKQNMKDIGVLDPLKVVRIALQNSSSIAGTLLTTDSLILDIEDKKTEQSDFGFM